MPLAPAVLARPYTPDAESTQTRRRSALRLVRQLLIDGLDLHEPHRTELLSIALWKWTEAAGVPPHAKYNLPYVSRGVLANPTQKVIHEHVFERRWLVKELKSHSAAMNDDELFAWLKRYAVACVVTKDEDANLRSVGSQGWQRYLDAGIEVWDRRTAKPKVVNVSELVRTAPVKPAPYRPVEAVEPSVDEDTPGAGTVPTRLSVVKAFDQMSGARAPLLQRLVRAADLAGAVAAIGSTRSQDREFGAYVRVHDATTDVSTRAVAYVHWNGRVSLGLQPDDLGPGWLSRPGVSTNGNDVYGVAVRVTDESTLRVAEDLLESALEKVRNEVYQAVP